MEARLTPNQKRFMEYAAGALLLLAFFMVILITSKFQPWMSKEAKIDKLAHTIGVTMDEARELAGCVEEISEKCTAAPIAGGKTVALYMGELWSLGGKWGSYQARKPDITSDLILETFPQTKYWNDIIPETPYHTAIVKARIRLADAAGAIHTGHKVRVKMEVIYPVTTDPYHFVNKRASFEKGIDLFLVTQDEYALMISLKNTVEDILVELFMIAFFLLFASIMWLGSKGMI